MAKTQLWLWKTPSNQKKSSRKPLSYATSPYHYQTGNQSTKIIQLITLRGTTNITTQIWLQLQLNMLFTLIVKRKKRRLNCFEFFCLPFETTSIGNREKRDYKTWWWLQNKDGLTSEGSDVSSQRKYQGGFLKIAQCWSKLTSAEVNNQTPCGRRVSDFESDTCKEKYFCWLWSCNWDRSLTRSRFSRFLLGLKYWLLHLITD